MYVYKTSSTRHQHLISSVPFSTTKNPSAQTSILSGKHFRISYLFSLVIIFVISSLGSVTNIFMGSIVIGLTYRSTPVC